MKDKTWKMKLMLTRADGGAGMEMSSDLNEHTKRALVRMVHGIETDTLAFVGLTLEEVEDIIKSNIQITDSRLYEGVYAVAVDVEMALMRKNT